jgi:L-ectoine synthase
MIVRTLDEVLKTNQNVESDNWVSRRFLVKKDGMGFSPSETTIYAGRDRDLVHEPL